jgi:hypothetical protein
MAKTKRIRLGSVIKGKDGKPDYIKVYIRDKDGKPGNYVLKDGQYLNLESKAQQLRDIAYLSENGKIDAETAKYLKEKAEKMADFVRFEVVAVEEK